MMLRSSSDRPHQRRITASVDRTTLGASLSFIPARHERRHLKQILGLHQNSAASLGARDRRSAADNMTYRSIRPLPCSTRIRPRALSISRYGARQPRPCATRWHRPSQAPFGRPGLQTASIKRATSATESTTCSDFGRPPGIGDSLGEVLATEGDPVEKPQRRDGLVEGGPGDGVLDQMNLISPDVLDADVLERTAIVWLDLRGRGNPL